MTYRDKPHFVIKKNLQKSKNTGVYFSDVLTPEVLEDVCLRITGTDQYTCAFVENDYQDDFLSNTYNKGRLAILHERETVHYISFSEANVNGRNSSVQSVPTAFNLFYCNGYPEKELHYYFLNAQKGNFETDYLLFMYRLMKTIGFHFLNDQKALGQPVQPFSSAEDMMLNRQVNSGKNKTNNATYLTKSRADAIDIYGKVYGANKYESSMLCYALSAVCRERQRVTLYEVLENDLKELPEISRQVIADMGVVRVVPSDLTLEKRWFKEGNSLRSPHYIYNLLERLGSKRCALCGCEIPELVQGAHIWPVAQIKKEHGMPDDQKLECAVDGHNGLWLCENHHKLFDENILMIDENGNVFCSRETPKEHRRFISAITPILKLPEALMTKKFRKYLKRRNEPLSEERYQQL